MINKLFEDKDLERLAKFFSIVDARPVLPTAITVTPHIFRIGATTSVPVVNGVYYFGNFYLPGSTFGTGTDNIAIKFDGSTIWGGFTRHYSPEPKLFRSAEVINPNPSNGGVITFIGWKVTINY